MMPRMEGGVLVEHSHRLAAGTVMILAIGLALLVTWSKSSAQRALCRPAWLAVALVFVQALLGGLTVIFRLPTPVSTAHTGTSLLFFMTVLFLAVRSRPAAEGGKEADRPELPGKVAGAAAIAAVGVYVQMVLGGLVRHSGAALVCLDIPFCRGSIWPDAHPTVLIQALHRLNALAVTVLVLISTALTWRHAKSRPGLRALALAAPVLVGIQIWLGIRSVQTFLELVTVELHLAVATALLASQVLLALWARPASQTAPARPWLLVARDMVTLAKPRITGLVVATFGGGLVLAPGTLPRWRVIMTMMGTALIVSAANALNMFIERDVDGLMDRTRNRPLPQHRLSPLTALTVGTLFATSAVPLLFLGANFLTGVLGVSAFLSYVAIYTPMKRTSPAALFVGAIPGALPPLMGWTTVTGRLDAGGLALFAILFLWQIPHFMAIGLYRAQDYARAGIKLWTLELSPRGSCYAIIVFSLALVGATFLLPPLHLAGMRYLGAAGLLGAAFVGFGAVGLRQAANRLWARSVFLASIVYLTLLFAALFVDHRLT
jgi:protoheme IX farnesyltransferase